MKHIFFIDSLKKLNSKKDTSLMIASTMKDENIECYLLFEEDFFLSNKSEMSFKVYNFSHEFYEDGCYLKKFELKDQRNLSLSKNDVIHMRIDPPFDTRYLRYLWMLRYYQEKGIKVVNSPDGILKYNEKLHAYTMPSSLETYVGSSESEFLNFIKKIEDQNEYVIMKPLDLYQGIGVEKVSIRESDLKNKFSSKVKENNGPVVVQPFCTDVVNGEIRSLYYNGKELGSILKTPKKGEFLANIAQGAEFKAISLSENLKKECDQICADLLKEGVSFVAFDIMGNHVSEINITCPGLLVEVSFAHKQNFAKLICRSSW